MLGVADGADSAANDNLATIALQNDTALTGKSTHTMSTSAVTRKC